MSPRGAKRSASLQRRLRRVHQAQSSVTIALAAEIKKIEQAGLDRSSVAPLIEAAKLKTDKLSERGHALSAELMKIIGISEEEVDALIEAKRPKYDERWWSSQILATPRTESLETLARQGTDALIGLVQPQWLLEQSAQPFRLGKSFLESPLEIVGNTRVNRDGGPTPQRFAHMLLVAHDFLAGRDDLDFYAAAEFVPEVAALGTRVGLVHALGPVATDKLTALTTLPDEEVHSTIYELLVGTACVLSGLSAEMLASTASHKSPDIRLHGLGVPAVIECKRRLALSEAQLKDACFVRDAYELLRNHARELGLHGIVSAEFRQPLDSLTTECLVDAARHLSQDHDTPVMATEWGEISYQRLPFSGATPETRLYAPNFLESVFGWSSQDNDWEGMICEVEPPVQIRVRRFRLPFCLKWKCTNEQALVRRTRDVNTLWARAVRQIPTGEVGFIYIAYSERQRGELADRRTKNILATADRWHKRWAVQVPITVINRLYFRCVGIGQPDLIESSLPGSLEGEDHWLGVLPTTVFVLEKA